MLWKEIEVSLYWSKKHFTVKINDRYNRCMTGNKETMFIQYHVTGNKETMFIQYHMTGNKGTMFIQYHMTGNKGTMFI